MSATCRSCNADIEWVTSMRTGKPMPLDAEPTTNGNLVVISGKARPYTDEDARLFRSRRTSHFATCAQAGEWRGSGR